MSDSFCTILNESLPLCFARDELCKYALKEENEHIHFKLGLEMDFLDKGLIKKPKLSNMYDLDAYYFRQKDHEIYIIGSNPRSVLFGVYFVLKKMYGYKWVSFLPEENLKYHDFHFHSRKIHFGRMKRRGLVVENYEDELFLVQLIDWAAKHHINEMFFTFKLWESMKHVLAPEIEKRGLTITLGGHSMHYLLDGIVDSKNAQIDFTTVEWRVPLFKKIRKICQESNAIQRVSLWPADIGASNDPKFLANYIQFSNELQANLKEIEVEHIAYNAGLSWEMLELINEEDASNEVNTLFAYWGRNYHQSFENEERAYRSLQKWQEAVQSNGKTLTIFEYYSDHFMLGDLFPPLFSRIHEDINLFKKMGIDSIVNLIVQYRLKEHALALDKRYPWQLTQLLNGYFFARLSWGDHFQDIEGDFYSNFGIKAKMVREALVKLESILSKSSKWNVPLFPNRLIDPEKVDQSEYVSEIVQDLKKWKNDIQELKEIRISIETITDFSSLISFYIYYISYKLEDYLSKWTEKFE